MMSPFELWAPTDVAMRADVEVHHQFVRTLNKQRLKRNPVGAFMCAENVVFLVMLREKMPSRDSYFSFGKRSWVAIINTSFQVVL